MTPLLFFWLLVIVSALVLVGLRELAEHDPRGSHVPPRSHHVDEFERSGSTFH